MKNILQIRLFQTLTTTVLFFILISSIACAQEKVIAALTPMDELDEFAEMEKQIIFNALQECIHIPYSLVSQKAFEAALTQAFTVLNYDECTIDQCFALIQQILHD